MKNYTFTKKKGNRGKNRIYLLKHKDSAESLFEEFLNWMNSKGFGREADRLQAQLDACGKGNFPNEEVLMQIRVWGRRGQFSLSCGNFRVHCYLHKEGVVFVFCGENPVFPTLGICSQRAAMVQNLKRRTF